VGSGSKNAPWGAVQKMSGIDRSKNDTDKPITCDDLQVVGFFAFRGF